MATARGKERRSIERDPHWYRDAVIYELHVRAFCDADGDGVGEFRGLTEKLDYLHDLGVTAIWLLPFYPSPGRDDGYDIADYTDVNPIYGTLRDIEVFLRAAHARGLRVITELVLNHTSDQHPWFQRARHAKPGSTWRDFYVWSDDPKRYADARVIFKDFETSNWTWDPVAKAYYWHRFYSHQPDLNFENKAVWKAVLQVVDFWLRLGVDGLRLDAVPYLFEEEGTNCENLPPTHAFLQALRRHVDEHFEDRMLLAEANQWPEDAAAYFGSGDECHMAFHFPVMPRLFMASHMEDRFPIIDILEQTPAIPETCQWALFLRNHDELTLEMVTDEERDYMYRVYAHDPQARINLGIRRRLAPLFGNHRRKIELMNGLLLSLPGTPVIYYGDEIGMGDNIYLGDRNGVRTPMQWSADRNAGFSRANPQRLYLPVVIDSEYHPEALNVEQQQNNLHSLLWWMKRLIALRKRYLAFGRGTLTFLYPENRKVLVFVRSYGEERILVVANLSRFVQYAELDLAAYRGLVPVELFGSTEFPPIGELPYFVTLGPHAFYWFALQEARAHEGQRPSAAPAQAAAGEPPRLTVADDWEEILAGQARRALEGILPAYLGRCRWFGGKSRRLKGVALVDAVALEDGATRAHLALVQATYVEGEAETYVLPLAYASGEAATAVAERGPTAVIARIRRRGAEEEGVLYDALFDKGFTELLLDTITRRRRFKGRTGTIAGVPAKPLRELRRSAVGPLEPTLMRAEQSNTSIVYGDKLILKMFRRSAEGENPDLEIGRFLTERTSFAHIPPVAGALSYQRPQRPPMTLGILQGFVANQGDAWGYTLDALDQFFERIVARRTELDTATLLPAASLVALTDETPPEAADEAIGPYLQSAWVLGERTAEMHFALASDPGDPAFAPEAFTTLYQRSLYQSMRSLAGQVMELLEKQRKRLSEEARTDADHVLGRQRAIDRRFRTMIERKLSAMRIRCHGDYHLGQVLWTGRDFAVIDFEGEPARSLSERRLKRSPLRDVAGMLRSYHYAAYARLLEPGASAPLLPDNLVLVEPWARFWYVWVAARFLKAYLRTAADAPFLPRTRPELELMLDVYMLEKALYEVRYELNSRPGWVGVPLKGIRQLIESAGTVE